MAGKDKKGNTNETKSLAGIVLPKFVIDSHASSLGRSLIEDDRGPNDREVLALRKKIADASQNVSIYLAEFPKEQSQASGFLETSRRRLATKNGELSIGSFLKAEEDLNRAVVILDRVNRETRSIQQMIGIVIITSVVYLGVVALFQYLSNVRNNFSLLGVPGMVLSWACVGGITAILFHRRSMLEKKWPFDLRWFWIIIRPLLGIIMGSFMYLGIISGLLLYGASSIQETPQQQVLWVLAFVGGFSDKFWEILINSVLGTYLEDKENNDEIQEHKQLENSH